MLRSTALLFLSLFAFTVLADESADSEPSEFDAAAAVAAASSKPESMRFERLWTSKHRVRLFHGLAISADGRRVVACKSNGQCVVFDGETGEPLAEVKEKLPGLVTCSALSADGALVALGFRNGAVVSIDASTGKVRSEHQAADKEPAKDHSGGIQLISFSSDGKRLSWLHHERGFHQVPLDGGEGEEFRPQLKHWMMGVMPSAFSPNGRTLVCYPTIIDLQAQWMHLSGPGDLPARQYATPQEEQPIGMALAEGIGVLATAGGKVTIYQRPATPQVGPKPVRHLTSFTRLTPDKSSNVFLGISGDEKWVMCASRRGQVEIRSVEYPHLPAVYDMDLKYASQMALAPNSLRVAAVDQDGYLAVFALPKEPDQPSWRFQREVDRLGMEKKWDEIEKLAAELEKDPEPFPFNAECPKYHYFYQNLFPGRSLNPPEDQPKFSQWLEEWLAARPKSRTARLLEVRRLIDEGWVARGSGFATEVTPEGWDVFHRKITEAHAKVKSLLEEEEPPPEVYMLLFDIAKAESWDDLKCMEYAEKAAEISPRYLMPHLCMVEQLLPR